MNYTPNYHLPQWSDTDRVLMTDFNAAMAAMETGLAAAQATADQGQAPVKTAQSTADAAQAAADAAQETADAALTKATAAWSIDNPYFAIRSYGGTGANTTLSIDAGFYPAAFLVTGSDGSSTAMVRGGKYMTHSCTWTNTGVTIKFNGESMNRSGISYICMFFR